ncbi:epithelial sodium channel subunit gamma-like [Babylonia areolata]|uniref:epithelial sodium channel subunit gamma-like n=1 Tax=Babylonia areolata TaxID=304850 RepID=UPI003FD55053
MPAAKSKRKDCVEDPMSPFQPSQPSTRTSNTKTRPPKTDLEFLQKVTAPTSGALVWDQSDKASETMGLKTVSSSNEKARRALQAFREAQSRRHSRVKQEFSQFCTETSFTPLVLIYKSSSWLRRIGWILLFLTMIAWLSVQCYWLLDKYFSYPLEVKLDLQAAKVLDFPSVTICNLNPLKKSAARDNPAFGPIVHYADQIDDDDMLYHYIYENLDSWLEWIGGCGGAWRGERGATYEWRESDASGGRDVRRSWRQVLRGTFRTPTEPRDAIIFLEDFDSDLKTLNNDEDDVEVAELDDVPNNPEDSRKATEDVSGEEVRRLARFRRSPGGGSDDDDDHHMERMMENSFNKWDALSSQSMDNSYYATRDTEYKTAMAYATVTVKMEEDKLRVSGHEINDLLLSCTFNGWQCSPSNFSYFHNYKFGNCYTFNSDKSPMVAKTKFPGPDFGLNMEMFIHQDEYVSALASEAGVRVLIHPRGSAPFPEDNGVSIAPGLSTSISIRMEEVQRLEPPHGTCNAAGSGSDLYVQTRNSTYSKLSCLKSCYQNIAITHCNCSLPIYIIPEGSTVCNMTDDAVDTCTSSLPETVPEEYSQCDLQCPQPC